MNKIIAFFAFTFFGFTPPDDCGGTYRWDNKILIDKEGLKVYKIKSKPSTINKLITIPKPANNLLGSNRSVPEKQKVTITAWITDLGKESDSDYHLILRTADRKKSLIAEIPDPYCPKLLHFPGLRDHFEKARKFIEEKVQEPASDILPVENPVKVKVTGVIFFDKGAHGNGHAENSIELHPVLKIQIAK